MKNVFHQLVAVGVISATASIAAASAAEADQRQCRIVGDQQRTATAEYYDPRIKQVNEAIKAIRESGSNPNDHGVRLAVADGSKKFFSFVEIRERLKNNKAESLQLVASKVDACNEEFAGLQDMMDKTVFIKTGGLSALLPERMTHIDVSDILAGYPLGGPKAVIPKARDDLLDSLNIGGDAAKVIRDPWNQTVGKAIEKIEDIF